MDGIDATMVMEQTTVLYCSSNWAMSKQATDHTPWRRRDNRKWPNGESWFKTGGKTGALPLGGCMLPIRIASPA